MIWIAYCITCQEELVACPNGMWAEGVAAIHAKDYKGHKAIVGYEPNEETKEEK